MIEPIVFAELRGTVYLDEVPEWAAAELPALYQSFFSTMEYFRVYDEATRISTCVLERPHHVVMFVRSGRDVTVLNKVFAIDPESAGRLCDTLFRLSPRPRRIKLEVMFEPSLLRHPNRTLIRGEDNVIWLLASVDQYRASLGAGTRKDLAKKRRRLERDFPEIRLEVHEKEAITAELVHIAVEMNRTGMRAKGVVSMYNADHEARLLQMARRFGIVVTLAAGDVPIGVQIMHQVGSHATLQVFAYDSRFAEYSVGMQVCYEALCEAIHRHLPAAHVGWGREDYKRRLAAIAASAWTISVYPTAEAKWLVLDEQVNLADRRLRSLLRRLARPGIRTAMRRLSDRKHGRAR